MRPVFLTGERVYLRPLLLADAKQATAWWAAPFPVSAARAEVHPRESHEPGWNGLNIRLVIARVDADDVVGGAEVGTHDQRAGWLTLHMAPCLAAADALQAEALGLLIPWLRDEHAMMVVTVPIADDETATLAAAERLNMTLGVRLRAHIARPSGHVETLLYQALGQGWRLPDA